MPHGIISGADGAALQKRQANKEQREREYQEQRKKWKQERLLEELERLQYKNAGRYPGDNR